MGGRKPFTGPVSARISFVLPQPSENAEVFRRKPDVDNLAKAVKDSLNKVCYDDDCQIVELMTTKNYTTEDPFVLIELKEVPRSYLSDLLKGLLRRIAGRHA